MRARPGKVLYRVVRLDCQEKLASRVQYVNASSGSCQDIPIGSHLEAVGNESGSQIERAFIQSLSAIVAHIKSIDSPIMNLDR